MISQFQLERKIKKKRAEERNKTTTKTNNDKSAQHIIKAKIHSKKWNSEIEMRRKKGLNSKGGTPKHKQSHEKKIQGEGSRRRDIKQK